MLSDYLYCFSFCGIFAPPQISTGAAPLWDPARVGYFCHADSWLRPRPVHFHAVSVALMFPLCSLATVSGGSRRSCWGVWGVIDTSPDFGGQNVLKTFEIAIRLNERPTRTGLERVFCRWIYFRLRSKIFFLPPFPPHGSATGDQAMTVPSARCSGYFLFFFLSN